AGETWRSLYAWSYGAKTVLAAAALWFLWSRYSPIRWNHWGLGLIVGVIGIFQWVGMQLYLQRFPSFEPSREPFNPFVQFQGHDGMMWAFIGMRIAGAVLLVPLVEELFWRDFL